MLYEFTVTLRPRWYSYPAHYQYANTAPLLKSLCSGYQCSFVAELTGENNVHYHGLIEIPSSGSRNQLLDRFRKYHNTFGRKSCTQVVNEPKYREYMQKDVSSTMSIIRDSPWVMDNFKIQQQRFEVSSSGAIIIV